MKVGVGWDHRCSHLGAGPFSGATTTFFPRLYLGVGQGGGGGGVGGKDVSFSGSCLSS